ncbi:MAG: hypothetical protein RLZZ15_3333 [Verrucomicrobiota bacterium]
MRSILRVLFFASLACVEFSPAACAYEEVAPPKKIVLPAARAPAESLASIRVAAGLRVELVAAEPLVMDPIDIAWGADGRLWVVEMADYPNGLDGRGAPGGRVRVLSSSRGDGRLDQSTLFADGLSFPNSVLPWRRGVLVAAAPDILYLEDTDGDGRADRVEKIFSGLAEGNQQHRVNGLQWGLDGWVHLANGNSGAKITSPKFPGVVDVGRRDFRVRPDEGRAEALAGQTQYGLNRDDWGRWFGGNNSNPFWHYALEDRYLRRNPHFVAPSATVDISATPGAAPIFPASTTLARFNDGHTANHFTSACGTMVYRDDLLGAEFAGNIFACEPVHNLVHREILAPAGATFASRRAPGEERSEFFASTDNWSRFTSARTGPDGALYVVDMYRQTIEHPTWIPAAWQKILGDLRAGADKGRIYRVVPADRPLRPVPRLDRAEAAGLVAALENPSGTVRDLAQQQLAWRRDASAIPLLEKLAANAARPVARAQALCALDTMGALTPAAVAAALRDAHPGVLVQAIRLSENFAVGAGEHAVLLSEIAGLATHADPAVRQQVAYTLGEWKTPAAGEALATLLRAEKDALVRAAAMSSALVHAEALLARLGTAGDTRAQVEIAVVTRQGPALARLLAAICEPAAPVDSSGAEQMIALVHVLETLRRHNLGGDWLRAQGGPAAAGAWAAAEKILAGARGVALDRGALLPGRVAAVGLLGADLDHRDENLAAFSTLLAPQTPLELQLAAVAAMGAADSRTAPTRLLAGWPGYGPKLRAAVLDLLTGRGAWATALLDRLEADRAMPAQIDAARRSALMHHANNAVAARAVRLFADTASPDRRAVVERYLAAMAPLPREAARGAAVFSNVCAGCHRFGAVAGQSIGPDLAGLADRSIEYLTTHILDPNRACEDRYQLYAATMRDGRVWSGMLTEETAGSVTLRGLDGAARAIARGEIATLVASGRSLMPEGLEAAVSPQGMADLAAFLGGAGGRKN